MTATRRAQLVRFGTWVSLATLAVLGVILTARTESGIRRIATLMSPQDHADRTVPPVQLANRDREEQRRVADAVRSLTADRDRLAARVAALEHNLDEVTGSIPPSTQAARSVPGGAGNPTASISAPATIPAAPSPSASQADGASGNQSRVAAGHLAAGNPSATESVATKTEFGVDIGSNASIDGLRTLWLALKAAQPALFEGLRPVIAVREGQKTGALELHLVAGPLPNASFAARLCAVLGTSGQNCQPTVFDGQRLALQ